MSKGGELGLATMSKMMVEAKTLGNLGFFIYSCKQPKSVIMVQNCCKDQGYSLICISR